MGLLNIPKTKIINSLKIIMNIPKTLTLSFKNDIIMNIKTKQGFKLWQKIHQKKEERFFKQFMV